MRGIPDVRLACGGAIALLGVALVDSRSDTTANENGPG